MTMMEQSCLKLAAISLLSRNQNFWIDFKLQMTNGIKRKKVWELAYGYVQALGIAKRIVD
jgi:hypothetical protein